MYHGFNTFYYDQVQGVSHVLFLTFSNPQETKTECVLVVCRVCDKTKSTETVFILIMNKTIL